MICLSCVVHLQIDSSTAQLERLRNVNVLTDLFLIWHQGPFGTISGAHLFHLILALDAARPSVCLGHSARTTTAWLPRRRKKPSEQNMPAFTHSITAQSHTKALAAIETGVPISFDPQRFAGADEIRRLVMHKVVCCTAILKQCFKALMSSHKACLMIMQSGAIRRVSAWKDTDCWGGLDRDQCSMGPGSPVAAHACSGATFALTTHTRTTQFQPSVICREMSFVESFVVCVQSANCILVQEISHRCSNLQMVEASRCT